MVYMHAVNLLLHSAFYFVLSVVKILLKREVGGRALNSHGNYIVDHGNHGIVFLYFCGNHVYVEVVFWLKTKLLSWAFYEFYSYLKYNIMFPSVGY